MTSEQHCCSNSSTVNGELRRGVESMPPSPLSESQHDRGPDQTNLASLLARKRRMAQRRSSSSEDLDEEEEEQTSTSSESEYGASPRVKRLRQVGSTTIDKDDALVSREQPSGSSVEKSLLVRGIKKQSRYVPCVPLSKDELSKWRKEARRVRNRESAAESRRKTRDRITELEQLIEQWETKYTQAVQRITELEEQLQRDRRPAVETVGGERCSSAVSPWSVTHPLTTSFRSISPSSSSSTTSASAAISPLCSPHLQSMSSSSSTQSTTDHSFSSKVQLSFLQQQPEEEEPFLLVNDSDLEFRAAARVTTTPRDLYQPKILRPTAVCVE